MVYTFSGPHVFRINTFFELILFFLFGRSRQVFIPELYAFALYVLLGHMRFLLEKVSDSTERFPGKREAEGGEREGKF